MFSISIGARVGIGFFTMVALLIACGAAGIIGVNKVSDSLLFVSGDAREASDGGMKTTINLQGEMLLTERILSNDLSKSDARKLMRQYSKEAKASMKAIRDTGLIDEKVLKKTDGLLRQYRGNRLSILSDFQTLKDQQAGFRDSTKNLLNEIADTQSKVRRIADSKLFDSDFFDRMQEVDNKLAAARLQALLISFRIENIFASTDPISQLTHLKKERESLAQAFDDALELMTAPELKEMKGSLTTKYKQLDQQSSQMVVDFISFRDDRELLSNIKDRLLKSLSVMEQQSGQVVEQEIATVDDLVNTASLWILIAAGSGVLVAMGALGIIIFTVVYPIRHVADNLKMIGEGEGDLSVSLKESGASELVTLASGFNAFVNKIRKTVSGVSDSISDLSQATDSLRSVSEESAHAIQLQYSETEHAAAAVNEMTSSAANVANHAQEAANAASSADQSASQGKHQVDNTITTIKRQIAQLDVASGVVEQLAQDSESIGSVLNVINEIAEQTNLLALNAAIEAARAGDAGRGFAVVADEVRQLASRTQTATTEIQDVIVKLQSAAGDAVSSMQESRSSAEESASQAIMSGESLEQITRETNTITDMNLQIAGAAEEQAEVAETINQNVVTISERASDTQMASQNIGASIEQLVQLSNRLQGLVSGFRH